MYKRIADVLIGSFLIALLITPTISSARIYLFDKKLEVNGSIEQKANWKYTLKDWERGRGDNNPNGLYSNGGRYPSRGTPTLFKTHLHLEGLYHAYNDGEKLLDVFGLFEWFYDWGPSMTGSYKRGQRARDRQSFKTPTEWGDIVRELYFNYVSGPWTIRVGKQMVVWGETSLQRTADVVNPVDIRSHMMGVDDWEDFKKGLWMFRGFYQTSLVNDLTFEVIWVPADFKAVSPSPEGTMYNSTYTGGFTSNLFNKWDDDLIDPKGLSDSQGGFRLRGFNWDWDWTFIYYNGYDAGPVVIDWGQPSRNGYRPVTPAGWALYRNGAGGFNLWAGEYNINALGGNPPIGRPAARMFDYKRVNNLGVTATKYVYKLPFFGLGEIPLKANVRFEAAYKIGVSFNNGSFDPSGSEWVVEGISKRDVFGYAFEIGKDLMPQFICKYNGQRSVDVTFGVYQDWIINGTSKIFKDSYGRGGGNKDSTSFSLSGVTDWINNELRTQLNCSYNTQGYGNIWAHFMYAPGVHWRFTLLPRYTWSNRGPYNNHGDTPAYRGYTEYADTNNYIHFKVGYLF